MRMMNWNVQSGGFASYDPSLVVPKRQADILDVIDELHINEGADSATLTDAYRWDEVYDGPQGIAKHLGYNAACYVRLGDKRLEANNGAGIGIAFASDEKIAHTRTLDLGNRLGLGVVLDVGRHGLQVANVYFDDISEDVRIRQATALQAELLPDVPTVLVGDFNSLRADTAGMSLRHKLGNRLVKVVAAVLPKTSALGASVAGMNERRLVPHIESLGFRDGDPRKQPTAPARAPAFGIDYVFQGDRTLVSDFKRIMPRHTGGASDHLPMTFDVAVD